MDELDDESEEKFLRSEVNSFVNRNFKSVDGMVMAIAKKELKQNVLAVTTQSLSRSNLGASKCIQKDYLETNPFFPGREMLVDGKLADTELVYKKRVISFVAFHLCPKALGKAEQLCIGGELQKVAVL